MVNPRLEINLEKIKHNTYKIVTDCRKAGIDVAAVTKVVCGSPVIARAMVEGGITCIADSRIENLIKLKSIRASKMLLRLPMISEAEEVVEYSDISLNSEYDTISALSREAAGQGKVHSIILMVDLGDLREGIWYEKVLDFVPRILSLNGIELAGIGTNLTCYGGVIPTVENLSVLTSLADAIRERYRIILPIVSGGNSSSLHLLYSGKMPPGINNLRIGEAIFLGRETAFGKQVDGLYDDAFAFYGEIVEIGQKPSMPLGIIGHDAFGSSPEFTDKGLMTRAIIAAGRQDIDYCALYPEDNDIKVIGASSDHLIVDITGCKKKYKIGDEVKFKMSYGCLLQAETSEYVKKVYI